MKVSRKHIFMKIAVVRGAFASPNELQNFEPLGKKHEVVIFGSKNSSIAPVNLPLRQLYSPYDWTKQRIVRGLINRVIVDSHYLFGLEDELKGYDIAHCAESYFHYTQQCLAAKKRGLIKKVVSTVWENIPFNNEGIRGRKEFKENAFENVDLFLPVTQNAREVLIQEGCSKNKIMVLKPGVNLNTFKPADAKSHEGIKRTNNIKILFVGRLEKEKGIVEVLEAFSKVRRTFKNVELLIVGTGSYFKTIEAPGVKWVGKVPYNEMPFLYSLSDIFVHYPVGSKTWQEQYGMVLIEALASGLPIVALDRGSIAEIVKEAGALITEGNLYEKLIEVISDKKLRSEMALKARFLAEKNYDSNTYSRKLEKIYETVSFN